MKKAPLVVAIILYIVAAALVTLVASYSPPEEVTIDLSELRAGQVIAGTNLVQPDFEPSYQLFIENSFRFDTVLVGMDRGYSHSTLIFLGKEFIREGEQWYRAEKKIEGLGRWFLGQWFLVAQEVRVDSQTQTLSIQYDKDRVAAGFTIFSLVAFFGLIGHIALKEARDG